MRASRLAGLLLACVGVVNAQQIQFGERPAEKGRGHVLLLTDAVELAAGTPQDVELRFRVDDGYHINSHAPKDELLIPTTLKLDSAAGLKLGEEHYPAGSAFRVKIGSGETLDVYQNEFRIGMRVSAPRGHSEITGELRYQACDSSSCFPPRTLPVKVLVTGK